MSDQSATLKHTPTRGHPTKRYAEQIGQSILVAAEVLFTRDGLEAATMDAVAVEAKISKGTLYARYANKSELYLAVVNRKLAELMLTFPMVAPSDYVAFDDWFLDFATCLAKSVSDPALIQFERSLGADLRRFPDLVAQFHLEAYRSSRRRNADALADASRHFGQPIGDPDFVAEALRSLVWGWARLAPADDPASSAALEVPRQAARLLLTGLGRGAPPIGRER